MRSATPLLAALVMVGIVFSGCINGGGTLEGTGDPSVAPPAEFAEDRGAVTGLVLDEEEKAVAGAQVGILTLELFTVTDANGRFTISHVAEGTHQVFVQRLGYDSAAVRVQVVAGQATELTVVLRQVVIAEPYTWFLQQNGLFGCGVSWRPAVVYSGVAACGVVAGSDYDQFLLRWRMEEPTEPWVTAIFEQTWQTNQVLGKGLTMVWEKNGCANTAAARFAREAGHSPLYARVDETRLKEVIGASSCASACTEELCTAMSRVFSSPDTLGPSSPADVGITVQQRFTQYFTSFFYDEAPEDYTAVPDA